MDAPNPEVLQRQVLSPTPATVADVSSAQAPASSSAAPLPAAISEDVMHKNRLQEYTQRSSLPLPIYQTINEGSPHAPKFRSAVFVDRVQYTSSNCFSHRKTAEQDVAKLALEKLVKKMKDEGCPLIREDTVFCKSILNEFAVKVNLGQPIYTTVQPKGLLPVFVSSLVFNGVTYKGDAGRTKKEAEQLAARAAILSLLGNSGSAKIVSEIIRSKFKLYAALHKVKEPDHAQFITLAMGENNECGSEIKASKDKEVQAPVAIDNVPISAIPETASGMHRPHHEFKRLRSEAPQEAISLEQPLGVGPSSAKKRKKNKKKTSNKLDGDAQVPIAATSSTQASPPCSEAQ